MDGSTPRLVARWATRFLDALPAEQKATLIETTLETGELDAVFQAFSDWVHDAELPANPVLSLRYDAQGTLLVFGDSSLARLQNQGGWERPNFAVGITGGVNANQPPVPQSHATPITGTDRPTLVQYHHVVGGQSLAPAPKARIVG